MGYEKEAFMSRGKRGKQNEDIIDFRLSTLADIPKSAVSSTMRSII